MKEILKITYSILSYFSVIHLLVGYFTATTYFVSLLTLDKIWKGK
jgi:hypothetical protein